MGWKRTLVRFPARPDSRISFGITRGRSMVTTRRGTKAGGEAADGPRILKKYPNRRLYDTRTSAYITLADVKKMVLEGESFEVRDAKSGDELTRSILLQIILEEETGGVPMFSTQMLAQIIRFYGHAMQGFLGSTLERNLQALAEMQSRFADQASMSPEGWAKMFGAQNPVMQNLMGSYLEQSKKMFEQMQEQMSKGESLFPNIPGFPPAKR
jgi:polyhydroxyalkanoate synthesis repressor PhaR